MMLSEIESLEETFIKKTGVQQGYVSQDVQRFYPECIIPETLKQMQNTTKLTTKGIVTDRRQIDTGIPVLAYNRECIKDGQIAELEADNRAMKETLDRICINNPLLCK